MKARRNGSIYRSLLDGEFYKVVTFGDSSVKATPVAAVKDHEKRGFVENPYSEEIEVDRKVFDELFYIVEEAPAAIPDELFEISDGKLMRNGKQVEIGTLVPEKIMTLVPGGVILSIKSLTDGKFDLRYYDTEGDRCPEMLKGHDAYELVTQRGCATAFLVKDAAHDVKIPAKDNADPTAEPVVVNTETEFVVYFDGPKYCGEEDADEIYPVLGEKIYEGSEETEEGITEVILYATQKAVRRVPGEYGTYHVREYDKDGKRTTVTRLLFKYPDGATVPYVNTDNVEFDGTIAKILPVSQDEEHNFVFVTENEIVHSNFGHGKRRAVGKNVLAAVEQYPIPIGIEFDGRRKTTMIFANNNFGVCKIHVEKRREDNLFIPTVEVVG